VQAHPDRGLTDPEFLGDLAEGVALFNQRHRLDLVGRQVREDLLPALARDDLAERRVLLRSLEPLLVRPVARLVALPGAKVILGTVDARAHEETREVLLEIRTGDGELGPKSERDFVNNVEGFDSPVEAPFGLQLPRDVGEVRQDLIE
jgi:hypothetical protein